jgi:hypothetical protein
MNRVLSVKSEIRTKLTWTDEYFQYLIGPYSIFSFQNEHYLYYLPVLRLSTVRVVQASSKYGEDSQLFLVYFDLARVPANNNSKTPPHTPTSEQTTSATASTMTDKSPDILTSHEESIKTNVKKDEDFRIYDENTSEQRVVDHYRDMRTFHTVDFYRRMEQKYSFENGTYRRFMTIEEAFEELESYVVSV